MAELDTSGRVAGNLDGLTVWYEFGDLDPFTQGYVEAMFASNRWGLGTAIYSGGDRTDRRDWIDAGFSDLAPETLARIIADCARAPKVFYGPSAEGGADLWKRRQEGTSGSHPPLTPYLGDDGLIYLKAADPPLPAPIKSSEGEKP